MSKEWVDEVSRYFQLMQEKICDGLEKIDGKGKFILDLWERPGGGGGRTRVLSNGNIIERGGVNFSAVHGEAPEFLKKQFSIGERERASFFATGLSIVIHPVLPSVPIIHMNVRYFEMDKGQSWFGGGIDLTPHYVNEADGKFFHSALKSMCEKHRRSYNEYKNQADDYFFIRHRNETRGIGGIFFDHLSATEKFSIEDQFGFIKETAETFLPVYSELIIRNKNKNQGEREKKWQRLRRGRYVEFNLVYDKGTKFGLETDGRAESILMSLPPVADWEYDFHPESGSEEEKTLSYLKKGIDWA